MSRRLLPFPLFLALASALSLAEPATPPLAGLTFERTSVVIAAELGAPSVEVEFPFTNPTNAPVEITTINSTCGCTVPSLEKLHYAPGEAGVLKARFDIGDRQGRQAKRITVHTSTGIQRLDLVVELPTRVTLAPRLVLFRQSDTQPKSARLEFSADTPVTLLSLSEPDPAFALDTQVIEPGRLFTIHARLTQTPEADTRSIVVIHTRGASGREYRDTLFFRYLP